MSIREFALTLLEAITFKRVLIALAVLAVMPAILGVASWSTPIVLTLLGSNAAESLAGSFLGVLANAAFVYALVRIGRALLECGHSGTP
jgi:hypothetical protein